MFQQLGSKDRLYRAKTIDLCQNPLTVCCIFHVRALCSDECIQKEPKLSRARQIPEWEEYDAEIAHFSRELAQEGKIHSRLATAGADILASAGVAPSKTEAEEEGVHPDNVLNRDEL